MSFVLSGYSPKNIAHAADILRHGGLVAFPTETVYGLGADATNERAVTRIFVVKGRPADHPLIVHLGRMEDLDRWGRDIPAPAWRLAERLWPGPLTLILKRAPGVPDVVTGRQDTIGLRVPDHPVALALLKAAGIGVAAPSANRFGRVSPTIAEHVIAELGDAIDGVVDGGPCSIGLESTILDLSGVRPLVLRPGGITPDALAQILGEVPDMAGQGGPRVPGRLPAHYAPGTPLRLLETAEIEPAVRAMLISGRPIAVLAMRAPSADIKGCSWRRMPADPKAYARVLYAYLREVDTADCHCIFVERPPAAIEWDAVHDRIGRAAAATRSGDAVCCTEQ